MRSHSFSVLFFCGAILLHRIASRSSTRITPIEPKERLEPCFSNSLAQNQSAKPLLMSAPSVPLPTREAGSLSRTAVSLYFDIR
ncbi:MAG: hypothetical protein LBE82_09820 [Chitinophagaceae bacterium]|nr:hypothetical protein [Chitinophagaceae bacterium]